MLTARIKACSSVAQLQVLLTSEAQLPDSLSASHLTAGLLRTAELLSSAQGPQLPGEVQGQARALGHHAQQQQQQQEQRQRQQHHQQQRDGREPRRTAVAAACADDPLRDQSDAVAAPSLLAWLLLRVRGCAELSSPAGASCVSAVMYALGRMRHPDSALMARLIDASEPHLPSYELEQLAKGSSSSGSSGGARPLRLRPRDVADLLSALARLHENAMADEKARRGWRRRGGAAAAAAGPAASASSASARASGVVGARRGGAAYARWLHATFTPRLAGDLLWGNDDSGGADGAHSRHAPDGSSGSARKPHTFDSSSSSARKPHLAPGGSSGTTHQPHAPDRSSGNGKPHLAPGAPQLRAYAARELVRVVRAVACLRQVPPVGWLRRMLASFVAGRRGQRRLDLANPQDLSNLAHSLAILRFRPSPYWLKAFFMVSQSKLRAFNPQNLANVLWALAVRLRVTPPLPWLLDHASAVRARLGTFQHRELVQVVAGLERAMRGATPGAGASGELRSLLADARTMLAVAGAGRERGLLDADAVIDAAAAAAAAAAASVGVAAADEAAQATPDGGGGASDRLVHID
ncbi:hypothetical protein FOA52_011328 [Chlamydomonas sp. UWO 241]|nr:hypothetical protein FOA52_011328 [Chlamydomonas sp. UWO 241]